MGSQARGVLPRPISPLRPGPKPPYMDVDPTTVGELTRMRTEPWVKWLRRTGYANLFPEASEEILNGIENGVDVGFHGPRDRDRDCINLRSATECEEIAQKVDAVIAKDVRDKKKAGPFEKRPAFPHFSISPIGAVPKKNSEKIRVIHHLSYPFGGDSINASVDDSYQPLGSFDQAADAVRAYGRSCSLIKLDVEAAYKQVPVRRKDWPLLGFKWRGMYYYERCLPFGLKSSCRLWELYATALHHFFVKSTAVNAVVHYVDDFLFVVVGESVAHSALKSALATCDELGVPMAPDKIEGPITRLTFLGIELDTAKMEARLSEDRLSDIKRLLMDWENKSAATVRETEQLVGTLQFAAKVVRTGRTFMRRIMDFARDGLQRTGQRDTEIKITASLRCDIEWWRRFISKWNGISLLYELEWIKATKLDLTTDACDAGFGAHYNGRWFRSDWSDSVTAEAFRLTRISMPFYELYALVTAAAAWGEEWCGKRIEFHCDCENVVKAIYNGTSKSHSQAALLRHLHTIAATHGFEFKVYHIAGVDNTLADLLSRDRMDEFFQHAPDANKEPDSFPQLPPVADM